MYIMPKQSLEIVKPLEDHVNQVQIEREFLGALIVPCDAEVYKFVASAARTDCAWMVAACKPSWPIYVSKYLYILW